MMLKLAAAILFVCSIAQSLLAASYAATAGHVCQNLQERGLVTGCTEGAPWAFEVPNAIEQRSFAPTANEIFKCYTVTDGHTHVPCTFKGTLIQFANADELAKGLRRIDAMNHHQNQLADLQANVTRADTTLEHYAFYEVARSSLLIVIPINEKLDEMVAYLESVYGSLISP